MLLGYNTIEYYESKSLQRWLTADNKDIVVVFVTNKIPAFIFVTETEQATATIQVFNADTDVAIDSPVAANVYEQATKTVLEYTGSTIAGDTLPEGYYYLKIITTGSTETYYSEVFGWKTDISDFLKITATSTAIIMANTWYGNPITYECYLFADKADTEIEIEEEGVEKPYGDIPSFNTLNLLNSFEVYGTRGIMIFLAGLRVLKTNGTVTFVFNGVSMTAYDLSVEKIETTAFDEVVILALKFREENYISSKNTI